MKTLNDIVEDVTTTLNDSGVLIKSKTVRWIVEAYIDQKRNYLAKGESIEEKGIGVTSVKFRRSNTFSGYVVPTVKLVTNCISSLKDEILSGLTKSEEIRDRISNRIDSEDLEYLRKEFGIDE
jgi:nucleoid DNA-binding protein